MEKIQGQRTSTKPWVNPVAFCGEDIQVGLLNQEAWCHHVPQGEHKRVVVPFS